MYKRSTTIRKFLSAGALLLVILLTVGCDQLDQALQPQPTPSRSATPSQVSETPTPQVVSTQRPSTPAPATTTLTFWTTEDLGPIGQAPGSRKLSAQIAAFEAANPNVKVDVVLKKPYGPGGMLDFLTSTAGAVPSALPDVAILDVQELRIAAQRDLIQPLDGRITPELAQDLVAAARSAGQVNGTWFGLPFQADVQHLIYNTELVATAPVTWTDVLSGTAQYLFPAGGHTVVAGEGSVVNDAYLIQYLGTGAPLVGEGGQPTLDQEAVAAVLQFYADGVSAGVIPKDADKYESVQDTWEVYLAEEVGMANVTAHLYLNRRDSFQKSSFAPIPTQDGTTTSILEGWAYVLVAPQSERQTVAWSLIEWLTESDRLGEWTSAANYPPTRLSAWPENQEDEYLTFLAELVQNAQARPTGSGHGDVGRALQRAVQTVVSGTATPAEAAAQAVASVQ